MNTLKDKYNVVKDIVEMFGYNIRFYNNRSYLYEGDIFVGPMDEKESEKIRRLSITTFEGLFTYQIVDIEGIEEYRISLDGADRKEITLSYITVNGITVPKVSITLQDENKDISNLEFDVTSHSIGVYVEKTNEREPVSSRSFSYENPNLDFDSSTLGQSFDLRKFISYEQGLNGVRNYIYFLNNSKGHVLTTSDYTHLLYERSVNWDYITPEKIDGVVTSLLNNPRVSSLFEYATSRIDEELPGLLPRVRKDIPFLDQISSTITKGDSTSNSQLVDSLFNSIKSDDINLPNETSNIQILKKGC